MSGGGRMGGAWGRAWAIAGNTLLELVRLKVFYFLLIFALLVIGSSAFMVKFSFQEQFQVLKDVGFGAMSIFSWLLAVLASAMLLPKDIEERTLYTILAKPVGRFEYFAGKWLGVMLLLLVSVGLMSAMFGATLYAREQVVIGEALAGAGHGAGDGHDHSQTVTREMVVSIRASTFTPGLLYGVAAVYLKAAVFATLTLFISTYASTTIFTVIVSVMVYFIGHVQSVAREYWLASGEGSWLSKAFLSLVALMFPDLQVFNLTDDIVVGNLMPPGVFLKMCLLGGGYLAVYFALAQWVFSAKEL